METEGDIDPLDAYMESIVAETTDSATKNPQKNDNPVGMELLDGVEEEEEEETEKSSAIDPESLKNLTAEELIALAQRQSKRKDLSQVDHREVKYLPFRKNFYVESPEISRMTEEEVNSYRNELDGIKIRGNKCPRPIRKWTQCGLSQRMYFTNPSMILSHIINGRLDVIKQCGFERPTPIQAQAIPAIMSGRDIIGIAKTGSGKTIAFLLPLFRHVLDQPAIGPHDGSIALIMTPTRELAMQIYADCRRFAKALNLRTVCAYGGAPIKDQIADCKRGAEILICTPGRLIDLLMANSGKVTNLKRVTYLVLDEADRMFDMGFGPQVTKILGNVRPDRQIVLFSATFPAQMEALARKYLVKPLEIVVGTRSTVSGDIEQLVEVISDDAKFLKLLDVLGRWYETRSNRILIFVDRQDAADALLKDLLRRGYHCQSLHGGKDQADRECAIADFKQGIIPILIATSVAARGLDVKDLKLVINYECPNHMEDYVHRVGRTGRAGNKGTAITFITPEQEKYAPEIVKALTMSHAEVPPSLQALADGFSQKLSSGNVQGVGSGFGGKGLERLDQEAERNRKTQKLLMGGEEAALSSDDEEEILALATGNTVSTSVSGNQHQSATTTTSAHDGAKRAKSETSAGSFRLYARPMVGAAMTPDLMNAIKKINQKIATITGDTNPDEVIDPLAMINARYRVTASSTTGEILAIYDRPSVPGNAPTPKSFYAEFDVNDYPQAARFKITHKDTLSVIMDYAGALIVVKGEHIPQGRPLKEGQRRLYLRIDGESEVSVERALKELRRVLFETVTEVVERGSLDAIRYGI